MINRNLDKIREELRECLEATLPLRKPFQSGYRTPSEDWYGRVYLLLEIGDFLASRASTDEQHDWYMLGKLAGATFIDHERRWGR